MCKEGSGLVILILRPALERMVVALVAVEPRGQPEVGGVFHDLIWCAEDLVVAGGRVGFVGARSGENFAGELIVRCVGFYLVSNPIPECFRAFSAKEFSVYQ